MLSASLPPAMAETNSKSMKTVLETKKLFKFICLGHREGILRDGAAFFKGG